MEALGIVTLLLTGFVIVYYAYMASHTDRDVSFFLSVSILSMFMNLCTNTAGFFAIAWLYLGIGVLFIGLGFAVGARETTAFYASIGPRLKSTFTDVKRIGWQTLSLVVFPAGIALYFVHYKKDFAHAKVCGRCALWGLLLWGLLLWTVLGLVL
jgi:hypothetical protein